jgi:hypothetical protein
MSLERSFEFGLGECFCRDPEKAVGSLVPGVARALSTDVPRELPEGYLPPLSFELSASVFWPLAIFAKRRVPCPSPLSEVSEGITPSVSDILNALTYANM